jgi:L-malate glycosyltransferase
VRVLHLLASPVFSGPAEAVALLAAAQQRAGATVKVAVDSTRAGTGTEESAVPRFEALGLLDSGGLALSAHPGVRTLWTDRGRLRHVEVDVIHCHTSHDHWLAWLGRPAGTRLVRSLHAPRSLRWSLPPADALTIPDAHLALQLWPGPVAVLPALVDTQLFQPSADRRTLRNALGLGAGPVVGMVSTFQAPRRHAVAIAAFAKLRQRAPETTLVLLGDGVLEPALRAQVTASRLEGSVKFVGYRRGVDFVHWLQALDELWVLGLGNDWAGRAALQARACNVRVVAARLGALPEWADAVLEDVSPEALADSALGGERRQVPLPDVDAVASEGLTLYRAAGVRTV